ncbi:hypothetical protein HDU97_004731 [Phlyctochytrium planicorne]|nr:hypothetical protein HDU97_004731 [Phlyctochytrium planicorne]
MQSSSRFASITSNNLPASITWKLNSQPLATQAGLSILAKGGNAADAAVAAAAVLNLTEPCSTGIGGDAFCLFYDSKSKTVKGLNASGRAPAALNLDAARKMGIEGDSIPSKNINSVTVPGAAAGWVDTIELFGSGKLTLAEILAPAIRLAEEGFPISPITAYFWKRSEALLQTASPNGGELLKNGKAPETGQIMKLPNLARTFRTLAEQGKPGFYTGRIAEEIVFLIKSKGGVMTLEDLAAHKSTPITPISFTYESSAPATTVHECPPNGQGITALMALGIIEALQASGKVPPLETLKHNGVEYLHILIEAMRIAFADSKYHVADPEVVNVPTEGLLSKEYLKERAKLFNPDKATVDVKEGAPANSSGTVYFSIVDGEGNACSFINSNYEGFGTGAIPKGCGFTLQNRGSNFVLKEGHPNCLAPRKRPYHTIIPAMATRGKDLYLSYGVMGGFMQPQGHVQVLLNMLHFKMNPQSSLDSPRFCITPTPEGFVDIEHGIEPEVVEALKAKGHKVRVLVNQARAQFGKGQIIEWKKDEESPTGFVLVAGSDPRGDGNAAPAGL